MIITNDTGRLTGINAADTRSDIAYAVTGAVSASVRECVEEYIKNRYRKIR